MKSIREIYTDSFIRMLQKDGNEQIRRLLMDISNINVQSITEKGAIGIKQKPLIKYHLKLARSVISVPGWTLRFEFFFFFKEPLPL